MKFSSRFNNNHHFHSYFTGKIIEIVNLVQWQYKIKGTPKHKTKEEIYCHDFGGCDYRRGMKWKLDLLTPLRTTCDYSATADLHTLKIALVCLCVYSVFVLSCV
jgi:hypothetical protein